VNKPQVGLAFTIRWKRLAGEALGQEHEAFVTQILSVSVFVSMPERVGAWASVPCLREASVVYPGG